MPDVDKGLVVIKQIDDFVAAVSKFVDEKDGLRGFFGSLSDTETDTFRELVDKLGGTNSEILFNMLDNKDYRDNVIRSIQSYDENQLITSVISGIEMWKTFTPISYERRKLIQYRRVNRQFISQFPLPLNEFLACRGSIEASSFREKLIYRGIIQLYAADKTLGDDDVLVIVDTVASFIYSCGQLLLSLMLTKDEREYIRIDDREGECKAILNALELVKRTIGELEKQFALKNSE